MKSAHTFRPSLKLTHSCGVTLDYTRCKNQCGDEPLYLKIDTYMSICICVYTARDACFVWTYATAEVGLSINWHSINNPQLILIAWTHTIATHEHTHNRTYASNTRTASKTSYNPPLRVLASFGWSNIEKLVGNSQNHSKQKTSHRNTNVASNQ